MVRRAAGDDLDAVIAADVQLQAVEDDLAVFDARQDGAAQGLGLLHDLLEHEVLVAALFRGGDLPVDVVVFLFDGQLHGVEELDAVAAEDGDLAVLHVDDVTGVFDQRRHVGGDEILALAEAEQQRRVLARGVDMIRIVRAEDAEGVRALDPVQDHVQSVRDRRDLGQAHAVFHELRDDLRVGLRGELHALLLQKFADLEIVFDDAVMDDGDLAVLGDVRVGVDIVRFAVGGPAGMADAERAGQLCAAVGLGDQVLQTALGLFDLQNAVLLHADARGVIAPVLQTRKALQQNGRSLISAYISYNTTHMKLFLL